jgi:DNA-binding MarR family transcriptional regulator
MSLIVLPYLGPDIARREQQRSVPPRPRATRTVRERDSGTVLERDALAGIPMRLTYRTALVLEAIAEQPGVSNRTVADYAGISDQGQISKLLARLERLGLVVNDGEGPTKGEPNAWTLTPTGQHVTDGIRLHTTRDTQAYGQGVVAR